MANDGKIYITISDKRFGSNVAEADAQNKIDKQKEEKKENTFGSWVQHQFFGLIKQQVIQNVSFTVNNIGNFTGDYQSQRNVQLGLSIMSEMSGLGTAIATGAKYGVPGVVVAIGTWTINKGISTAQQYALINLQIRKQEYSIEQLRNRAGLNPYIDGSN